MKVELILTSEKVLRFGSLRRGDVGVYQGNHYVRAIGSRGEISFFCFETCNYYLYKDFSEVALEKIYPEGSKALIELTV